MELVASTWGDLIQNISTTLDVSFGYNWSILSLGCSPLLLDSNKETNTASEKLNLHSLGCENQPILALG